MQLTTRRMLLEEPFEQDGEKWTRPHRQMGRMLHIRVNGDWKFPSI